MQQTIRLKATAMVAFFIVGCSPLDPNTKPEYGKESGLPKNCRAYVQVAINGYRTNQYSASDTMAGLERNCGEFGVLWGK